MHLFVCFFFCKNFIYAIKLHVWLHTMFRFICFVLNLNVFEAKKLEKKEKEKEKLVVRMNEIIFFFWTFIHSLDCKPNERKMLHQHEKWTLWLKAFLPLNENCIYQLVVSCSFIHFNLFFSSVSVFLAIAINATVNSQTSLTEGAKV